MKPQNRILKPGMEGEDVLRLQVELRALGIYKGETTGIFDKTTEVAISDFQKVRSGKQPSKKLDTSSKAVVDQKMADAITSEYELFLARNRLGIPDMAATAIARLRRAGILSLGDVSRFNSKLLVATTKLDKKLLARLGQMAELSHATGLSPRNVYALVEIGGIKSVNEMQALSEDDLRKIFKTAGDKGILAPGDLRQRDFFIERWVRRHPKVVLKDLRNTFPSLDETIAKELATAGILKGSNLRNMDVEIIVKRIKIDQSRLKNLKDASELLQVRGISPNAAFALVENAGIAGLGGLAKLDLATFNKKIESVKQAGVLHFNEAKALESQANEIIEAAQTAQCMLDPCSEQSYLDYLTNLLGSGDEAAPAATEGDSEKMSQAIRALQENLCVNDKPFMTRQEWCNHQKVKYFPETAYQFKLPMIVGENDSIDTITRQVEHILAIVPSASGGIYGVLHNNLERIPKIIDADYQISIGHQEFANMEFGSALRHYTTAESSLIGAIPFYIGAVKLLEDLRTGQIINKDSLAIQIMQFINVRWGIEALYEAFVSELPELIPTMEELYKYRRNYNPQSNETDGTERLTGVLGSNLILLYISLAQSDWFLGKYGNKFLSVLVDRTLSLILHYLYFLIPISKADTYHELGNYMDSNYYYNLVYDLDESREVYPFLNPIIELPLVKIRHGTNLLEWADSYYRENTPESIIRANCLYTKVLALHDDCVSSNDDQFSAMRVTIEALLQLNYDNLSNPPSLGRILEAVANIQHRHNRIGEIPGAYRQIHEFLQTIPQKPDDAFKTEIANCLSKELQLDIRFSSSRQVFTVTGANGLNTSSQSAPTLAYTAPSTTPCRVPCNPVIEVQIQKARMRLSQIQGEFNILGYRDKMVPSLRYPYLVNQAKMFVQLAVQAEKDLIQFLSNAEQESFNQLTAQQALAIAAANVSLEQARATVAQQRIGLAKLQRDQLQQEIVDLQIEINEASATIFEDAEWAEASEAYASTFSLFGVPIGTIANQYTGGQAGEHLGWPARAAAWGFGTVAEFADKRFVWFGGRSTKPPIEIRREAAEKARLNQINKLARQRDLLQNFGLPIANQQIEIANGEHEVAQRQVAVAQLQVEHAQQILSFLQTKFLNKELWYELAKEIRAIYRKLLDYAITTAFLAEQALEYELNQQLNVIRFDYYKPGKQGLLGAEKLQADIATIEYQRVILAEKKRIPVKAVISLGEEYPLELLRFTSNGRAHFATDFRQFDLLYPGAYQSRISRVEVVIEGLVPPEGIRGTLSTSGISYVRTRDNQIQPLAGNPETLVLSSYTIRGDQLVFYKTDEELELFEGLGTVTDWSLEIPKEANNMNYQTITDVKLVIYYTALFDDNLHNLMLRRRPKGGDAYQGFSLRLQFPDDFYHFNNEITKNGNQYTASLKFETSEIYFPTNQQHRRIVNLNMVLASSDNPLPNNLPFKLICEAIKDGSLVEKEAKFIRQNAYKNVQACSNVGALKPDGTPKRANPLNAFSSLDLDQKWELHLSLGSNDPSDPNFHQEFFKKNDKEEFVPDLSQIVDVLFFVEYAYDSTNLIISEHFDKDTTHWLPSDGSQWRLSRGSYQGTASGGQGALAKLDMDKALSHHPSEMRDSLRRSITDNVMMSFRTRLKKHANDDNGVRFYFANGYYMLSLGREGTGPRLSKLATAYDGNTATPLKEELNNPEFMLKPARWYTVEIGKFLGNIDVSINGAEVFNVFDNDPREGPGIGVGTSGTGKAYFDDIRI